MKKVNYFKTLALGISVLSFAAQAQSIKEEMNAIAHEQMNEAKGALERGDIAFSADQSQKLFNELQISTGVVPGEERIGFVVCTNATVSMGNVDTARCRIEKRAPHALRKQK